MLETISSGGFTFIEILVSLTMLAIIITAYVTLYTNSYDGIFYAGRNSKAQKLAQHDIENAIGVNSNANNGQLAISFPSNPIQVTGNFVTINKTYTDSSAGTKTVTVTTFAASHFKVNPTNPPECIINNSYSYTFTTSGGTQPYSYSITSGSLPTGLTINPNTGVVSGTPTEVGLFTFALSVTDSATGTQAKSVHTFAINIKQS